MAQQQRVDDRHEAILHQYQIPIIYGETMRQQLGRDHEIFASGMARKSLPSVNDDLVLRAS